MSLYTYSKQCARQTQGQGVYLHESIFKRSISCFKCIGAASLHGYCLACTSLFIQYASNNIWNTTFQILFCVFLSQILSFSFTDITCRVYNKNNRYFFSE
ncbi:hypothetical protein NQD34_011915 [Periophthalmus magnuspinnatus]|nr:hypothetical protein NQD34_011915 [Periophthalmus magnuspinnatus]